MQRDCHISKVDIVWFQMFDYALSVLKDKATEENMMTPELLQKMRNLQNLEPGMSVLARERFGEVAGRTDSATDLRVWI